MTFDWDVFLEYAENDEYLKSLTVEQKEKFYREYLQLNEELERRMTKKYNQRSSNRFVTDGVWHSYPEEVPDARHSHCLVRFPDGEERELAYDDVYGWCWDWDDMDYPHFIYDFDCEWTVILGDTEEDNDDDY